MGILPYGAPDDDDVKKFLSSTEKIYNIIASALDKI